VPFFGSRNQGVTAVARRVRCRWPALLAVIVLAVACSDSATTTTGPPSSSSTSASTSSSSLPVTTSTSATTTSSPTTTVLPTTTSATFLPDVPQVIAGWSLERGDVLVANGDGVQLLRDGERVGSLITSPTEVTFADGSGGLVVQMPDPGRYPDYWPAGGDGSVWRITPEADVQLAFRATPMPAASYPPTLDLLALVVIAPLSAEPSLVFVEYTHYPGGGVSLKRLWALPLDGTAEPTQIPADLPGEGSVTGLGWQPPNERFLMATSSDGGEWFSAWDLDGTELAWPTNPANRDDPWPPDRDCGHCVWTLAPIPETSLIAYVDSANHPEESPSDLVIYDTAAGREVDRLQVADTKVWVTRLHSDGETVAISRLAWRDTHYEYLPVLLYDLSTGSVTELNVAGVATLVGPRFIS
jgi:hypothetical protein